MSKLYIFLLGVLLGSFVTYELTKDEIISKTTETDFKKGVVVTDTIKSEIKDSLVSVSKNEIKKIESNLVSENKIKKIESNLVSENEVKKIEKFLVSKKINNITVEIELFSVISPESLNIRLIGSETIINHTRVDTLTITNTVVVEESVSWLEKTAYIGVGVILTIILL